MYWKVKNNNLIYLNDNENIELNNQLINKFNNYRELNIYKIKACWDKFLLNIKNNLLSDKDTILSDKYFDTKLLF